MASTLRMRTAISPGQWQPWTAVSSLLGLISMALARRKGLTEDHRSRRLLPRRVQKHSFKRQLHRLNLQFDQNVDIFCFRNLTLQAQKNAMASVLELILRCFGAGGAFYLVQ